MSAASDTWQTRDQATRLRELMDRRSPPTRPGARTIAVASGKGGVGKTNVAVNLAICLAGRGLRVTLLDMDMGLANADLLLGIQPALNLAHVVSGQRRLEEVLVTAPGDIRFVPGASGVGRLADLTEFERQHVISQMQQLEHDSDVLVFDCGAGISRNVLSFSLAADTCLLVTTPEPTAVTDAYALAKLLLQAERHGGIQLLVNLAEHRREARDVLTRVSNAVQRFLKYPIADAGYMLQDTHVELAVRQRAPFVLRYPRCTASACLNAIANRLVRDGLSTRRGGGFFRRVVGLFV